jgi:hypothetical protein
VVSTDAALDGEVRGNPSQSFSGHGRKGTFRKMLQIFWLSAQYGC